MKRTLVSKVPKAKAMSPTSTKYITTGSDGKTEQRTPGNFAWASDSMKYKGLDTQHVQLTLTITMEIQIVLPLAHTPSLCSPIHCCYDCMKSDINCGDVNECPERLTTTREYHSGPS